MKTNNLLLRSLIALVALLGSMTASAQEAYVIKSTDNTTLTFYYDNLKATRPGTPYALNEGSNNPGWRTISSPVTTVEFDPSFANARPTSTCRWFDGMVELTSITGIEYLNTSEVTNMKYMFTNLFRLPILDLSGFNTAKVTDMQGMFFNCSGLKTIYVGPSWSTAGLQDPSTVSMFDECNNLEGGKGTAFSDNSEHKYADYAHIDGGEDNPGYFTDPTAVLAYVIKSTDNTKLTFYYDDLKSTRVGTPYELNGIGSYPAWYLDGSNTAITKVVFDDSFADARPRGGSWWFSGMPNLTSIIDIDNLNTENMRVMSAMFEGCSNLTSLDVSGFNTAKVQVTSSMFADCSKLTSLDLRNFNTAMIEDMAYMFRGCTNLVTIYVSNGWSVTDETTSTKMFDGCTNLMGGKGTVYDANHVDATYAHIDGGPSNPGYLTQAPTIDVYAIFDNESRTMTHYYDEKIEERRATLATGERIIEGQGYDSFYWGDEGENLDPVKVVFDASYARYDASWSNGQIDGYFKYFSSLEIIEGLEYLNMSGVTDLSYLFADCTALTTLDLTRLDTRNITNMEGMFSGCTSLTTIYVSEKWNTDKVTISAKMFEDCNQLVGGQGTTFDAGHIDKEYARLDGGTDSPGYFTGPVPYAVITSDFTLTFYNDGQKNARQGISYDLNEGEGAPDWREVPHAVKSVVFDRSFKTARPTTTVLWFEGMSSLESVTNLQYLNTSEVTNMSWMFRGCSALENLDLSSFNTANVTDMHDMFENCICLKSLNVSSFNTAKVTDMGNMFSDCRSLTTLDLSNFDTRNVKTMSGMFYGCSGLTDLDLTNFTTATIEKMNAMFSGCNNLVTLDITSFDTRKVTDMAGMFRGCSELKTIYIGPKWNTEQVSSSENMFYNCTSIVGGQGTTYDPNHVDKTYAHRDRTSYPGYMTAKVKDYGLYVGGVSMTDWNVFVPIRDGNIQEGSVTFYDNGDEHLLTLANTVIDCTDAYGIFMDTTYPYNNLKISFLGENKLINVGNHTPIALSSHTTIDGQLTIDGDGESIRILNGKNLIIDGSEIVASKIVSIDAASTLTVKGARTEINLTGGISGFASMTLENGLTIVKPEGGYYDTTNKYVANSDGTQCTDGVIIKNVPYVVYDSSNTTLIFYGDGQRTTHNGEAETVYDLNEGANAPGWYSDESYKNVTSVVFHESFGNVYPTSTYYWFRDMEKLTSIADIKYLNTHDVTTMRAMFSGCKALQSLDVSNFKSFGVTDLAYMFSNCSSLTRLEFKRFQTMHVTNMSYMFDHCSSLTDLNVKEFNTRYLTDMSYMFNYCESMTSIDLSSFNTAKVTDMSHMFHGCTNMRTICVGDGWSTNNVTQSNNMFTGCDNLVGGVGTVFASNHVDKEYARVDGGTSAPGYFVDLSYNDTPYALLSADGTTLTFYRDSQRLTRSERTYNLNTDKQVPGWLGNNGNSNITTVVFDPSFADVRPTTTYAWFKDMGNLTSITGIEYLNTSEVTDMSWMFSLCWSMETFDLSHFDTQKVTNMDYMFNYCEGMTSIDVSSFDTQNVMYMEGMFYECSALTALDLSSFNTQNVKSFKDMFFDCVGLTSLDLNHFDTQNAETMNGMFIDCTGLTNLNLSGFNTEHVDDMNSMFSGCSSLTKLDLSDFDTSCLLTAEFMFFNCTKLQTIYVGNGWDVTDVGESAGMFSFCTNLKGGMGTTYDADHVDAAYARIDGGADNPGYFTEKPALIPGDANDDGVVSIADVTAVVGHILGQPVGYFNTKAADVNHSGSVTIADAKIIVEVLLGNIDLEVFMMETEALQNRMEACEDYYEKAKEYLESIDSGHAQTTLWQMASEIEAMMAEVQKQLENVSSEYEAEECLKNMHELQDQIEILNAEIYELHQDASV